MFLDIYADAYCNKSVTGLPASRALILYYQDCVYFRKFTLCIIFESRFSVCASDNALFYVNNLLNKGGISLNIHASYRMHEKGRHK